MNMLKAPVAAAVLALSAVASIADVVTLPLDLSAGTIGFGRSSPAGVFSDVYAFSVLGSPLSLTASASSSTSAAQRLLFTSIVITDAANDIIATFARDLTSDVHEFYALSPITLAAGNYNLIVSGANSPTRRAASYMGNLVVTDSSVPEPGSLLLSAVGLGMAAGVSRQRRR